MAARKRAKMRVRGGGTEGEGVAAARSWGMRAAAAGRDQSLPAPLQALLRCPSQTGKKIPLDYGSRQVATGVPRPYIVCPPFVLRVPILPPLVHIVDDDPQVRAATSYLLSSHGYPTEIYAGGEEFLRDAQLDRGCVLLDLKMPDVSGHQVQEELARRGAPLPVVVMSGQDDLAAAVRAMKLGALDFIQKPPREDDLIAAVERASGAIARGEGRRRGRLEAAARLQLLSPRELQILQGLLGGLSNKAIARELGLSPRTVEMHRANMMGDLGIASLSEALRLAIDAGLPPLEEGKPPPSADLAALVAEAEAEGRTAPPPPSPGLEDKVRLVLEASTDGAWEWNIRTGELAVSSRLAERLGYTLEDVPDTFESLRPLIHPADWDEFNRRLQEHLAGRSETLMAEFRVKRAGGGWAWLFDCGSVVERDPATGLPLRMVGTATDITERKEEERRTSDAGELLELAQWGAGAGTWSLDLEAGRLYLCPRSRAMHGMSPDETEELTEEQWAEHVHPEDLPRAFAALQEAARSNGTSRIEYRTVAPDGSVRWVLGLGKIVENPATGARRFVGLNQDVTEHKQAAAELERMQRVLMKVSRDSAMGTMFSALAHELAQPLTAITSFARGIGKRLAGTPAFEDPKLRDAVEGTERSARLAAEILGRMSRQVSTGEVEREPASLSALVRETFKLALSDADGCGIRYCIDVAPDADEVSVDPVHIQQLLLNLVRNAADALGEVPVPRRRLTVAARRTATDAVEVRVEDSGPGIPAGIAGRLFEPFVTTKPDGIGIGLSICRSIVEAHGGQIRAEAGAEGGAAFVFTLQA